VAKLEEVTMGGQTTEFGLGTVLRGMGVFWMLAAALLITGCQQSRVTLNMVAVPPVNEATPGDGESRIVDIRVYQLKSDALFRAATVERLWTDAEGALGDELLETRREIRVFPPPGAPTTVVIEPLKLETRFIGVLALYSRADDQGERKIVVPVEQAGSAIFELSGYHIRVR
jgi:type VI secretion system VasD/TssJ family lipoprotein